jgi:hypothetical protein
LVALAGWRAGERASLACVHRAAAESAAALAKRMAGRRARDDEAWGRFIAQFGRAPPPTTPRPKRPAQLTKRPAQLTQALN